MGNVLLESGLPAVGLKVKVYSKSLRQEKLLAKTVTGNRGQYKLKYPASDVKNIIVRVFNKDSDEPLVTSSIILKAGEKEKLDLRIEKEGYKGLSLYETIERDIASFIDVVDIKKLDDEELDLLSSESGLSKEHIKLYQRAQQSGDKNLSPELLFAIAYNKKSISNADLVNLSRRKQ